MVAHIGAHRLYKLMEREPWEEEAACKDVPSSVFFPVSENPETIGKARAICDVCPVFDACRELALSLPPSWTGIYAGMSRQDRLEARGKKTGRKSDPKTPPKYRRDGSSMRARARELGVNPSTYWRNRNIGRHIDSEKGTE